MVGCNIRKIPKLRQPVKKDDVIFNTVPVQIFQAQQLQKLSGKTLCIDLASKPGGFDLEVAQQRSVKVIWALSLPGKVAPVTSGAIVRETVMNILQEAGKLSAL